MSVRRVEPAVGLLRGGTRIRVTGSGFDVAVRILVKIGPREMVSARVLSPTLLECTSPTEAGVGKHALEVSRNGVDFTSDETLFEYQPTPRLDGRMAL